MTNHRDIQEAPYYCEICPAKFTATKTWRRHRFTSGHRVHAVMRGEDARSSMGQGSKPLKFEGEDADSRPMSKSYFDLFWGLFIQAGQVPEVMEEDTETDGDVDQAQPKSADVEREDGQAPASLGPVRESEMEVSIESAPDRPEPGVQSSNRATAAGACTLCSIILEDVLDSRLWAPSARSS